MSVARAPLSVVVVCRDERDRIRECLESARFAEEIVVVDSGSVDGTLEIARGIADRVETREWEGFARQKRHAVSLARHEWVFLLDADESIPPRLRTEVERVVAEPSNAPGGATRTTRPLAAEAPAGYRVAVLSHFLGREIRHGGWHPARTVRLFRRSAATLPDRALHERVEVNGAVGDLECPLDHRPYGDFGGQIRTIEQYSRLAADDWAKSGRRFSLAGAILRPPIKFLETYVWKRGCLDGFPGLAISLATSFYVFAKYVRLWEMRGGLAPGDRPHRVGARKEGD